jgi:hypothetical protein
MSDEDRPRRFGRRRTDIEPVESLGGLRAELVLLREENARLKSAQHRPPDIGRLLSQAREASHERPDDAALSDETTRAWVEALVIRESLLEICLEIERAMVSFEAKLKALEPGRLDGGSA